MSNYKKIMLDKGIMHKEVLENVRRIDNRVDKPLLSKFVNDVCLPTPNVLDCICDTIGCDVLDIYDPQEIDLLHKNSTNSPQKQNKSGLSHGENIYNLTVEIPRDVAERVFNKKSLKKLGFRTKTECIRRFVFYLDKKLEKIAKKEKVVFENDFKNNL